MASHAQDAAIIHTADKAVLAKLSCVEHGYYDDPFVRPMSRGLDAGPSRGSSMMEPIIRRGTHARVMAIDRAIAAFLSLSLKSSSNEDDGCKVKRQIVILGSGRDTSYLRYRLGQLGNNDSSQNEFVRWYEVDHPSIICQKAFDWLPVSMPTGYECNRTAVTHDDCNANESYVLSISKAEAKDLSTSQDNSSYHLIGYDLRHSTSKLFDILSHPRHQYDKSIPTLFILECVMMYLPNDKSRELIHYLAASVNDVVSNRDVFVAVAIYDPVPCHDRFGQVMIQNLQKAGIVKQRRDCDDPIQLSLEATHTVVDQLSKLIQCGFDSVVGCDMMDAYNNGVIRIEETQRAARCEMLDELEEFVLLMRHYCFCVGVRANGTSVGYGLCGIGKNSLMGFQEGHCTSLAK